MYGNYPDLSDVKRVLVIKLRHLGDVLLTSPVFSLLKKNLPHADIDALIYQDSIPMLQDHPAIADCLTYDRAIKKQSFFKRFLYEAKLLKQIRSKGYDLVINLTEGDRGAIAAWASGSRFKVGFDPKNKGFFGKKKIYTHIVKDCTRPRHTVERNLDALRRIGIFPTVEERYLTYVISEEANKRCAALLGNLQHYIMIHPVSRWKFKCLPTKTIARLIAALHERGEKVVLTSGPDSEEKKMVEEIIQQVPDVPVVNLSGQLSLKELGALIQKSQCLITVDSVPLHMASALQAPVVVMFGPSSEENWGPWHHARSRVITHASPCRPCNLDGCGGSKVSDCLHRITVQSILSAVEDLTSHNNLPRI